MDALFRKIAVRHGMAYYSNAHALTAKQGKNLPRGRALARAGPYGHNRDNGLRRPQHRGLDVKCLERRAGLLHIAPAFINIVTRYVTVREYDLINFVLFDETFEVGLRLDGNAVRVAFACKHRRVNPVLDVGNLRCRESRHADVIAAAIRGVEDMKILAGGTHDNNAFCHIYLFGSGVNSQL